MGVGDNKMAEVYFSLFGSIILAYFFQITGHGFYDLSTLVDGMWIAGIRTSVHT